MSIMPYFTLLSAILVAVSVQLYVSLVASNDSFLSSICTSVVPKSNNYQLTNITKSPYYLIQSSNYFEDERPILVELGGNSFRGFLLVAVDPLSGSRIGKWIEARGTYILPCAAVIHSDYRIKKHALLVWKPPANTKGYVAFEATILDLNNRFVVGQVSILPHQLYTHYQTNPIYEPVSRSSPVSAQYKSIGNNNGHILASNHPNQLSLGRRDYTIGDLLGHVSPNDQSLVPSQSGQSTIANSELLHSIANQHNPCDQSKVSSSLQPNFHLSPTSNHDVIFKLFKA